MKNLTLLFCLLFTYVIFAEDVKISLVKIKLNPIDAFGLLKVHGELKLNVDKQSFEVDSVDSEFLIKAMGLGVGETIKENFPVYYKRTIDLIPGNAVTLPGFNKKKVLASMLINDPIRASNSEVINYELKVNHLLGFGENASEICQKTESLNFKLVQNKLSFKLIYPNHAYSVTEIKLFIEALGKEKRLSHIEVISKDRTSIVKYKGCKKVTK